MRKNNYFDSQLELATALRAVSAFLSEIKVKDCNNLGEPEFKIIGWLDSIASELSHCYGQRDLQFERRVSWSRYKGNLKWLIKQSIRMYYELFYYNHVFNKENLKPLYDFIKIAQKEFNRITLNGVL